MQDHCKYVLCIFMMATPGPYNSPNALIVTQYFADLFVTVINEMLKSAPSYTSIKD